MERGQVSEIKCPACHQTIIGGECGGEGEGLCEAALYTEGHETTPGMALDEWNELNPTKPPPSRLLMTEIREAFMRERLLPRR